MPAFRIVVADSRSPRDGKFIEEIGTYNPLKKGDNFSLKLDRAQYWISPVERAGMTVYELRLDPADVGKIIGRQGVTINAIRSLLLAGSAKKGLRCSVEIVEEGKA
jgi:ribosomal protein S16